MSAFSEALVDEVLSLKVPLQNIYIILPTQRSGIEIKRSLSKKLEGASWLPQISTINQWASEVSGLTAANQIELTSLFYKAYRKVLGDRVVDTKYAHFKRSRNFSITGYRLKPNIKKRKVDMSFSSSIVSV